MEDEDNFSAPEVEVSVPEDEDFAPEEEASVPDDEDFVPEEEASVPEEEDPASEDASEFVRLSSLLISLYRVSFVSAPVTIAIKGTP